MKQATLILSVLMFFFSCKQQADEPAIVDSVQNDSPSDTTAPLVYNKSLKPVLFEVTSTGCPGCGSWGKPTFSQMISEFNEDVIPLAVHIKYGDPMITPYSNDIAANRYGSRFTPQLWVNDSLGMVLQNGRIASELSITRLRELIQNGQQPTDFTAAGSSKLKERQLIARTGIKLNDVSNASDYLLSCYLIGNGFKHTQAGYAGKNPATHNHVIIDAAHDSWGQLIEPEADSTFSFEHVFNLENVRVEELHLVSLVWKKEQNRYRCIGGFRF
jgi:hypothetical protein